MLTSSSSHGQRDLKPDSTKSAKSKSAKANCGCETYEAELAALKQEMLTPKWLFAQVADKCILDMSGDTPTIESASFHEDTEMFSDRPFRYENTTLTPDWFTNFNELFSDEDGFPNAAMTLVKDDESLGVVVSAFVNGYIEGGESEGDETVYGYNLNQSEEQKKVKSLEELMDDEDKMEFDHCTFFIDAADVGCLGSRLPQGFVSDMRLKRNIKRISESPFGIPTYTFKYQEGIKVANNYVLDSKSTFVGAMGQDLLELAPDAVIMGKEDGYYRVDYSKIDVNFYKL